MTNLTNNAFDDTMLRSQPRFAVYTHDTFGLGHIRRCLHIIRELSREYPQSAILLVTGSPALHYLKDLPPNVDIVKIPTVVKTGAKGSLPSHLPLGLPEMTQIRSRIICETILSFDPEVFIVDNFPLGAQAELLPVLKALKPLHTQTILGLRDILDGGDVVTAEWTRQGIYDVIDRYYNRVLIYGVKEVFDVVKEYQIPPDVAKKVHYCGYVTAVDAVHYSAEEIRRKLGVDGKFILATGGGGGDAFPLLDALIDAQPQVSDSHVVIFAGPLMGEGDRSTLQAKINGNPKILLMEFTQDLRPYLKAADLLVSMCGYNIAAEIVFHKTKAVVAPRTWRFGEHMKRKETREEKEQIMRADMLAKFGIVQMLEPDDLNPKNLAEKITAALQDSNGMHVPETIEVNGLQTAIRHIKESLYA